MINQYDKRGVICRGCRDYDPIECLRTPIIYESKYNPEMICPCSVCLVKMVCMEKCDDAINFNKTKLIVQSLVKLHEENQKWQ